MKSFKDRFNEALKLKNTTCAQIAQKTGIYESTLSNYKKGKYAPKQDKLELIARALNVSIPWLMGADVSIGQFEIPDNDSENNVKSLRVEIDEDIDKDDLVTITGVIPVYGEIAAGISNLAEQRVIDYIPTVVKNPSKYFGLKVKGDSMINAGIPDGCYVVFLKQETAENGQIVACRVNGDEATLKRFRQQGDTILLSPENPKYEPIIISAADFESGYAQILGVAKQVITKIT